MILVTFSWYWIIHEFRNFRILIFYILTILLIGLNGTDILKSLG